ncbi:MAG: hypothetical protein ACREFW_00915, partial [Rhizomicrobium sp.]
GTAGNHIIARVTGISHAASQSSEQLASGSEQISAQAAGDLTGTLANEAREKQGVTVNQQLLQQTIGQS